MAIAILEKEMGLINELYQPLQKMAIDTILEAKENGLNVGAYSTYRSPDEQNLLYRKGRDINGNVVDKNEVVTNSSGGLSFHNYRLALDIVFKNDSGWTWEASEMQWKFLGAIGKKHGFEWGGNWHFMDRPHFQYINGLPDIHICKNILETKGLDEVLKLFSVDKIA